MKLTKAQREKLIDAIENAIFDRDEPGCRDTEQGDMLFTEIGRIRIHKLLAAIGESH